MLRTFTFATAAALLAAAAPVAANEVFSCEFNIECIGADRPCVAKVPLSAQLAHVSGDGWALHAEDEDTVTFSELPDGSTQMRRFLSLNSDSDAEAVSLLSIFEDGQAYLSIHGIFLSPGFVTHKGTCVPGAD